MMYTGLLAACMCGPVAQADWLGPKVDSHLAPFLYSLREPSELLQWLCHDDSIIVCCGYCYYYHLSV